MNTAFPVTVFVSNQMVADNQIVADEDVQCGSWAIVWLCAYTVDATDVRSTTGMAQAVDRSGLTTYNALGLRRSWAVVVIMAGDIITADTVMMFPLSALIQTFH